MLFNKNAVILANEFKNETKAIFSNRKDLQVRGELGLIPLIGSFCVKIEIVVHRLHSCLLPGLQNLLSTPFVSVLFFS